MQQSSLTMVPPKIGSKPAAVAIATLILVALGDLLLFDADPGLNLFLYALALGAAVAVAAWWRGRRREAALAVVVAGLFALPLVETPSLPGLALAVLGLALAALIGGKLLPRRLEQMPPALVRFLLPAPLRLIRDAASLRAETRRAGWQTLILGLGAWIVPLALGLVFVVLFAAANPIIEALLSGLRAETALDLLHPVRLVFWAILAAGIWALLRPRLLRRARRNGPRPAASLSEPAWLGHDVILRSLMVFNALFALETGLDLAFLWGGMALPNGMSHADYAQRGAYPLIASALLAGGFVLVAMREGGVGQQSRLIRGLVYAFIGQNVLLCFSAMLRLERYVEAFSLTEMRLVAGLWMGLVAVGLVLILLRIWLGRSNAWLVASNLATVLLVVYGLAAIDTAAFIARFNVEHSREVTGKGQPVDLAYLQHLGPTAIPALDRFLDEAPFGYPSRSAAEELREHLAELASYPAKDWRDWSWRRQRLAHYLEAQQLASEQARLHNNAPEPR